MGIEGMFEYMFDLLKGVDSLIAVFFLAIFIILFAPFNMPEKTKVAAVRLMVVGLCLSIANSFGLRLAEILNN